MDWFLYDNCLRRERVKSSPTVHDPSTLSILKTFSNISNKVKINTKITFLK